MKIAIYSRKSKETDTGESIKNQINICKQYFTRNHEECSFETFEDEGFSGGNINRPSFQRMMQLAKYKQFDIVACYKIDRISRNTLDFLTVYEELKKYEVQLVSVTEGFDPSTPAGKMMMSMISSIAEMERMNIAQRVKDNMLELGKMGRWSGGTPPTGYKSVSITNILGKKETYLELIPQFTEKLQIIFNMACEGYTPGRIGKEVNIPTKTIANIITNPVYLSATEESSNYLKSLGYKVYGELTGKGFIPYNRRPKINGKSVWNYKDMFVSSSKHETPISDEIWIKANKIYRARGTEAKPRVSPNSFLSHMVKCSCGSSMFIHPGHPNKEGKVTYYFRCAAKKNNKDSCSAKWLPVNLVESEFLDTLRKIQLNKDLLNSYINKNVNFDYDEEIKNIKSQIKNKKDAVEKLTNNLIQIEGPAVDIITAKINDISNKINDLNEDLLKAEREKIFNSQDTLNIDYLYDTINAFINDFDTLPIEGKQMVVKSLLKEIKYDGKGKITIKFFGGN